MYRVLDPLANPPCGLAEYKNPFSAKDLTLSEACKTVPSFCLVKIEDTYRLKRQHDYYHQVQCQFYCDDKQWCDFVVKTNQNLQVERIHRDQEWLDKQLPKLEVFYFNAMLPELACPRYRKSGISEIITSWIAVSIKCVTNISYNSEAFRNTFFLATQDTEASITSPTSPPRLCSTHNHSSAFFSTAA